MNITITRETSNTMNSLCGASLSESAVSTHESAMKDCSEKSDCRACSTIARAKGAAAAAQHVELDERTRSITRNSRAGRRNTQDGTHTHLLTSPMPWRLCICRSRQSERPAQACTEWSSG